MGNITSGKRKAVQCEDRRNEMAHLRTERGQYGWNKERGRKYDSR
jgi:hypothetical protein